MVELALRHAFEAEREAGHSGVRHELRLELAERDGHLAAVGLEHAGDERRLAHARVDAERAHPVDVPLATRLVRVLAAGVALELDRALLEEGRLEVGATGGAADRDRRDGGDGFVQVERVILLLGWLGQFPGWLSSEELRTKWQLSEHTAGAEGQQEGAESLAHLERSVDAEH